MPKTRTQYTCTSCGSVSLKWIGNCPSCKEWNTYVEETISKKQRETKDLFEPAHDGKASLLNAISPLETPRIPLPFDPEFTRILGGGLVPGSVVLIGGQPGIGKSTLLLQLACNSDRPVLYVSGEESREQIKLRAQRITKETNQCFVLADNQIENILRQANEIRPGVVVIDSIQTMNTESVDGISGSVSQIRESTNLLGQYAKNTNVPVLIIGHITKEGALAGPKVLEHIVDVVLHFEGDRNYEYRILRSTKNRFGSTDDLGFYEMRVDGLIPVLNPAQFLLSNSPSSYSGSCVAASVEGQRPLLIEVQALVSSAIYGNPQRNSTGFDTRRLGMLLAVLEKRAGLFFGQHDIFVNVAGGIKITDPSVDLALIAAILSSLNDLAVSKTICFAGEVALSGEVRPVSRAEQRIQEAAKMGFTEIYISSQQKIGSDNNQALKVQRINQVADLVSVLFA